MRCLIDTNILIFALTRTGYLERNVESILSDYDNSLYISSLSVFEALHLFENGRIKSKFKSCKEFLNAIDEFNITILHTKNEHFDTYAKLEKVKNHNDPTDRIIISQAMTEKLTLISSDTKFKEYKQLDFIYNRK